MKIDWKNWKHVTKLDPDKQLPPESVEEIVTSGTDALMLSGTLNVTKENLTVLREQVKQYGVPMVVEPADPSGVIFEEVQGLFVPSVLNTPDPTWIIGKHESWVKKDANIRWDLVVPEAYIVLNPKSSVGRVTKAICDLPKEDVCAFAKVADKYFNFPIVYIEYSGTYGNPEIVKAVSETIEDSVLYYGGGINCGEKAAEMGKYADTIVVGNAVYDNGSKALKETVRAVQ
ncbi:phosphoglycerol geranylgeranyltransferase [Methanoplanus sp. FWC-SCC4]|uniref:Geranylgeranylglyceryl phosphate synthase n=1 Tax=Methanochimaera problematica TaxID=2609417 RepID=A0AA97FAR0_9EURY|nr:phosphoglycerol geranylgeranyltransferase [Methanoplanus sp. FWC-SCC4]WOF15682.1 phosphoglycerol geranylgeranyltransferase [Methanoplanus sp. FWC-SCC4]